MAALSMFRRFAIHLSGCPALSRLKPGQRTILTESFAKGRGRIPDKGRWGGTRFGSRLERVRQTGAALLALGLILGVEAAGADSRSISRPALQVRGIPAPLPDHPGNIFLEHERVLVRWPQGLAESARSWRLLDVTGKTVELGALDRSTEGLTPSATLGIGYYRAEFLDGAGATVGWTSAAVLGRLPAPVPADSPVCVDAAISWFAHQNPVNQRRHASLAALAGVNWVRDRLRWREIEPAPGQFATNTTYDSAADIEHAAGLQVLQVFHDTPPWAWEAGARGGEFAADLRQVYRLGRALARRFRGRVQAWEPWNEANVQTFGGHTVDQMCSWQKAAWFGFKAGDPDVRVGWNVVTTVPTEQHAEGLTLNSAWPYFDTYNIHTYDWAHDYADLWGPARAAAGGKPLWVTESDRGVKHQNDPPWFDLSPRDERLKAEYIAQSYAQSLFAGASRHFHFILGHYHEPSGVQFGLLRRDFTPRPAYVALAAVGRLLAGAQCLGRWQPEPDLHLYAFRARPDGKLRDVLVAWTERAVDWPERGGKHRAWSPPNAPDVKGVFDFMGRPQDTAWPRALTSAPTFIVLPEGRSRALPFAAPPSSARVRGGRPCPVVLQVLAPRDARVRIEDKPWSEAWAYAVREGQASRFELGVYHFGPRQAAGRLELTALPDGWRVGPASLDLTLQPMDRLTQELTIEVPPRTARDGWVQFRGDLGRRGVSALAFRIVVRDGPR